MTKDDIIKWARKWGDWNGQTIEFNDVGLELFANLVAAAAKEEMNDQWLEEARKAEREACADICDQHATCEGTAQLCAAAIRARSNP